MTHFYSSRIVAVTETPKISPTFWYKHFTLHKPEPIIYLNTTHFTSPSYSSWFAIALPSDTCDADNGLILYKDSRKRASLAVSLNCTVSLLHNICFAIFCLLRWWGPTKRPTLLVNTSVVYCPPIKSVISFTLIYNNIMIHLGGIYNVL